ncbi:MAG: dihydroneopterin aldolase [SAR202 cluster bacterium]|nr:dihydroneopterin aldolase [Chloroflexota bacterium]MQF94595.1 dihydroneopterin aldolase [SAR202 cluster bacterium]HAA94907.1 dihydroneopterin aldolase [Dehalococcoidia bacterium]MBO20340.1 dihydroneopterin aldolase [Chloroflexota bacterium]MQG33451.1 dihydroneopterin aldolase [SAR202 cluster bacterium]|tara:strand:- start:3266 stop:3649 length:384 start_codon:yes stop_codon:yes gene_type:complete
MSSEFSRDDRIVLEGMRFYGFHGVNPEERVLGQEYVVDLTVEMDLGPAGESDRLEDTVSYAHIYRAVKDVMEGEPKNLLEAAAQAVADRVLAEFSVDSVGVRVKKPHPPIRGSVIENATVEIYRNRG